MEGGDDEGESRLVGERGHRARTRHQRDQPAPRNAKASLHGIPQFGAQSIDTEKRNDFFPRSPARRPGPGRQGSLINVYRGLRE